MAEMPGGDCVCRAGRRRPLAAPPKNKSRTYALPRRAWLRTAFGWDACPVRQILLQTPLEVFYFTLDMFETKT